MNVPAGGQTWGQSSGQELGGHETRPDERPVFVFQHGLGGDAAQCAALVPVEAQFRVATLECSGHGSSPFARSPSIAAFTDDVAQFAARDAGLEQEEAPSVPWVLGGISMGAAIALRLACGAWKSARDGTRMGVRNGELDHSEAAVGAGADISARPPAALILVRPAWLFDDAPENMVPFLELARVLSEQGLESSAQAFEKTDAYRAVLAVSPDNARSLLDQFKRPRAVANAEASAHMLAAIAQDGPGVDADDAGRLKLRTLVIGCPDDFIHPLAHARALAAIIPGARLIETVSKSREPALHEQQVRIAIGDFLTAVHTRG